MKNFTSIIFSDQKIKKLLLLLIISISIPFYSYSTHIVGGELNYKCLGGNQYQITLTVYRDCYNGVPPFDNPAAVGVFDVNNVLVTTVYLNFPGSTVVPPTLAQSNKCVKIPTNICVEVAKYVGTVTLPPKAGGYQLAYQRCCRNSTINNIINPGNTGATYYARIPDQSIACNSNPVFKNFPPIFVCANNQIVFDHSATDIDGDVIVYSLCAPLDGGTTANSQPDPPTAPPYNPVTFKAPYSATNPLGGGSPLTINSNTGSMTGTPTTLGQFVVGVCADEYRGGVLISTTKRDFQFNVINCQPDIVSAATATLTSCVSRTVSFTNNSTGSTNFFWNFGDLTTLSDTSRLTNPTYNYPSVGTYTVSLIAFSGVNAKCNDTLKNFVVNVTACPPCTMTLGMSKVDATCGSAGAGGCAHIVYPTACTGGNALMNSYGNGGGISVSCGSGASANVGVPTGTTPTSINLVVNSVTLTSSPPAAPPATITYTGNPLATCPKTASCTMNAGLVTFDYYLWLIPTASPGSATVTPFGGTGPYTYSWTPSGGNAATAASLAAGTYTVTVTDNAGCQKTGSIIINSTSAMTVTTSQTPLSACGASNATGKATPSNGVGPYTYLWSNGQTTQTATGLSVGVYTVNVMDNGCSLSKTITISQPITINPGITSTNAKCNGNNGTATLAPTGGSGPYTYSWSTTPVKTTATASGLFPGTYSVTITDVGGCTGTATASITDVSLTLTSASVDPVCGGNNNGTASITATGGTLPYTYLWDSSPAQTTATATGLQGGTYIGKVTDNAGCISSVTITINQPSPLLPEPKNTSTISCAGVTTGSAHVDVSGGTAAFTYLWNNGQTTQNITGLSTGTYTITVTDSKGCTAKNSINVTPPGPLSLSYLPSNITTCFGDNTGAVTINPTGGNPGYTYLWNTTPVKTTQSITGLTAGTYTVTVTDITGCTASLNNVVVSQPTIVALSTGNTTVGCTASNGTASITATGGTGAYTYLWSPSGKTTATATGLSAGTYNVTVTDANGCSKTSSVTVTNAVAPTSGISSQSNVKCKGSATGSATITATGGTPGYTYLWSPGGNTNSAVSGLTSGSYNVTITDTKGCTSTQTVAITQPASALSATAASSNATCGSSNGTATVTASGGTPTLTYVWSPSGQTTITASNLSAGSYNITVTDGNGCTKGASVSVNNAGGPTVGISGIVGNVKCTGSATGSATVTATGGTGILTYSWNNGVASTTGTVTNLTAGTYIVTVTDANGCAQGQTVIITEPASAIGFTTSAIDAACGGSNGSAMVTATGGTPTYTYNWSPAGGTNSTANNLSAGTYIVTITDNNGCTKTASAAVTNLSGPTASISAQLNVKCNGSATGSATVSAAGGTPTYTYNWNTGATTIGVTGLTAGTYSVIVSDNNGCSSTQSVIITQPATVLTSTVSSQSNVNCFGSATGSATVTGAGGIPAYTYNWSSGQTTSAITGLAAGTYNVTVTDVNGCLSTQSVIITQPVASLTITSGSTNAACGSSNGTVSITATGGTPTYIYNWSTGQTTTTVTGLTAGTYTIITTDNNGCSQTATVIVPGSPGPSITGKSSTNVTCNGLNNGTATLSVSSGTAPYIYTWNPNVTTKNSITGLSPATYTVVVSDSAGCKDSTVITITQPLPLIFTLSTSNVTVCAGQSLTILTSPPSGGTAPFTFNWLPNGPVVSPLVPTTYTVTVKDSKGCVSLAETILITPLPAPIASFDTLSSGIFHQIYAFTDISTGGITWYWDFGDGTTSTVENPIHTYPNAGTYIITQIVTGPSGCADTVTKVIVIRPNILIPNVFTPNHDGINDEFWIPNTGFESFTLEIFNRWGTKLFETNAGDIRWDGYTTAGVAVPDGTYYYILNAVMKDETGGTNYDAHGFINLCRGGGK